MFKFAIEKFLISFMLIFAFIAFLGVFYYAYHIEVNNPPPTSDVAPFKNTVEPVRSNEIFQIDPNAPLSKPHVNDKEIENWLSAAVAEALTFSGRDYESVLRKVRPYFTASGFARYKEALEKAGIIKSLESGAFTVGVFFETSPYIGRGLVYEGIYRWQAKMPHSLSFRSTRTGELVNRDLDLDLLIRRVPKTQSESGIQIENWQIKPLRR